MKIGEFVIAKSTAGLLTRYWGIKPGQMFKVVDIVTGTYCTIVHLTDPTTGRRLCAEQRDLEPVRR